MTSCHWNKKKQSCSPAPPKLRITIFGTNNQAFKGNPFHLNCNVSQFHDTEEGLHTQEQANKLLSHRVKMLI